MNPVVDQGAIDPCWNRIGVFGDQRCEKLPEHVHCRNCDVYQTAAQRIMQRRLPVGYEHDWANWFGEERQAPMATDRSVLVFRIGQEWLALPNQAIVTIAETAVVHSVPHRTNPVLKGLVNVGGKLYPCMSMAHLLGLEKQSAETAGTSARTARNRYARLLLVLFDLQKYAIPVDDVQGIVHYASTTIEAVPTTLAVGLTPYVNGVITAGEMRIGSLDHELVAYNFAKVLR